MGQKVVVSVEFAHSCKGEDIGSVYVSYISRTGRTYHEYIGLPQLAFVHETWVLALTHHILSNPHTSNN